MRLAFVVPVYRVDGLMGGVGVRVWELARVLAPELAVTVLARGTSDLHAEGVEIVPFSEESWRRTLDEAAAFVFYDMPDTRLVLAAHRAGKLVVSDASVPIEHLEYHGVRHAAAPDDAYRELVRRYELQLLVSDLLLWRSAVARVSTIAGLALVGRLGYSLYDRSPALADLLAPMPIGYSRQSERQAAAARPSRPAVDFVWNGGIWDFYDPVTAIEAIARLERGGRPASLHFMYPPPADQVLTEAGRVRAAVERLGLGHRVSFEPAPLDHRHRDGVVRSARAALCLGKEGIENATAVRLRLRDSFLYRLPIVVDRHGATGDLVEALGIGLTVDGGDPAEVAAALAELAAGGETYRAAVDRLERVRGDFEIDRHAAPLIERVRSGRRAPDAGSPAVEARLAALLAAHPELERSPEYPF